MRLSESLRKGIMETGAGGIINRFKINARRTTLFFERILAEFINECEKAGYSENIEILGKKWMLLTYGIIPGFIKKMPAQLQINVAKKIWINLGLIDDLKIKRHKENILEIKTKNEFITRTVGKNKFAPGAFCGILSFVYHKDVKCINVFQNKFQSIYLFKITEEKEILVESKNTEVYKNLNKFKPTRGTQMKDALKSKIFRMDDNNMIFFRGEFIIPIENTIFHLIANEKISLGKISEISFRYFNSIVDKKTSKIGKIKLLKNLLQMMGWGLVNVIVVDKSMIVKIKNPPYGIQKEKDNWEFISMTILGYLWLINKDFKIKSIEESHRCLEIKFYLQRKNN